jgi:predicted ArsR family transcriptional regulator
MTTEETPAERPERPNRLLDAGALRALAHPLRVQIFDILSQYGAQTASSLAAMLGESSGATSYHLRALAKQDLIREVAGRGTARERWWARPAGGVEFGNPEAMRTPSGRAAMYLVVNETLNRRQQQLLHWVGTAMDNEPQEWQDGTLVSTATARLSPAQMTELTERITALIDETVDKYRDQQGEDVRPVTIRADVFPLPAEGELP